MKKNRKWSRGGGEHLPNVLLFYINLYVSMKNKIAKILQPVGACSDLEFFLFFSCAKILNLEY